MQSNRALERTAARRAFTFRRDFLFHGSFTSLSVADLVSR